MAPFNFIGNIIWLIFGGLISALIYFVCGTLFMLTIIGIPFGIQCFKIGLVVLAPFGIEVYHKENSSGCLTSIFNIIWLLCGGLWTAIAHIVFGVLFYITIIGIPFGRQHFKLVEISMMPFGKDFR